MNFEQIDILTLENIEKEYNSFFDSANEDNSISGYCTIYCNCVDGRNANKTISDVQYCRTWLPVINTYYSGNWIVCRKRYWAGPCGDANGNNEIVNGGKVISYGA